jgi:molybdenum cofactor sulfurtransferase
LLATEYVDRARSHALQFFRADPEHFDIVFVANATAAIKLVGYCFQEKGFWYGYHRDSHTSMVGVREIASGGFHCFNSDDELEKWVDSQNEDIPLLPVDGSGMHHPEKNNGSPKLIGYPAQSNMNGHRTPTNWAARIREVARSGDKEVYTLLDAAAYCSSAQLDLSDPDAAPDFISLSFYKIFGMPDLGALIVRKTSSAILRSRRYFGGGTVDMVLPYDSFHAIKTESIHEVLEDGTLPFHSLIMLDLAITLHKRLFRSMDAVSKHSSQLALSLHKGMSRLRHANGQSVCEIYQDSNSTYGNSITQGPTIAFNIRMENGAIVHYDHVGALASACNIQIRTGGVCNPGGIAGYLRLASWEMRRNYCEGFRCGEPFKVRAGKPTGIVRASLGGMSSQKDVDTFVAFLQHFFVDDQEQNMRVQKPSFKGHQHPWIAKQIQVFPVRHCSGWKLPANQSWEIESARLAMDGDWCLVDIRNEKVLDDPSATKRLSIDLDIKLGKLLLQGIVHGISSHISVDLWGLPKGDWLADSLEQLPSSKYRLARKFTSGDIEGFITAVVGYPATLARFFEFPKDLPIDLSLEKRPIRRAAQGIKVQFSEDIQRTDVHIVLSPRGRKRIHCQKYPRSLRFGTQTLIYANSIEDNIHDQNLGVVGRYFRRSDDTETIVSQNTSIRSSDFVLASWLDPVTIEEANFEVLQFCPVVGCGEKRDDYTRLAEHLTSHAKSFVPPHRKKWRGKMGQLACF